MRPIRASALGCVALGLLGAPGFAQLSPAVFCTASAAPAAVYSDGIAEAVADIDIFCEADESDSGPADSPIRLAVSVSLNTSVSNAVGEPLQGEFTDAVLVVGGNDCPRPSRQGSTFGSCGAPSDAVQDPQFGRLASVATLEWSDVTVPHPAVASGSGGSRAPTLRIRGIRASPSQLRLAGGGGRAGLPVTASISLRSRPAVALRNATLQVAYPLPALEVEVAGPESWSACSGDGSAAASIRIREGFPNALRSGSPESGGIAPSRVLLEFTAVPDGVAVSLPPALACHQPDHDGVDPLLPDALVLGMVTGHRLDGSGGTVSMASGQSGPTVPVSVSGGRGMAVYEVLADESALLEDCHVPVRFDAESGRATGLHLDVSASLGPRGSGAGPQSERGFPRFAAPSAEARASIDLTPCSTALLFPFVSNQAGFTTSLVITHGSREALTGSLEGLPGSCDLHYYGATSEETEVLLVQYSTQIDPGDQLVFTLSGGNRERNILGTEQFQGYLMALCGFPNARGYAFISDGFGGIPDLAMGYLARMVSVDPSGKRIVASGDIR